MPPLDGISAGFGSKSYLKRFGIMHWGIDIPAPQRTPVKAIDAGVVSKVGDNAYDFFKPSFVDIDHGTYTSRYVHVTHILVREGERVKKGEEIALSGGRPRSRGAGFLTTAPHLHLETIVNGKPVNPLPYLPAL